jgi:hypothetical protein
MMVFGGGYGSWQDVFLDESGVKLLAPAPITFAIWGPIFFLLGLFYLYQARDLMPGREEVEMPFIHQVSVFFFLSTLMATVWFLTWVSRMIWASVASMIIYLLTILAAYLRLDINLLDRSWRERLFVTSGWSMYGGWITVATLVNATTGLKYTGFNNLPFTELQWTLTASIIALAVYLGFLFYRKDQIFAGVGAWAFMGISLTHINPAPPSNTIILTTSIGGAGIIITAMILQYLRKRQFS